MKIFLGTMISKEDVKKGAELLKIKGAPLKHGNYYARIVHNLFPPKEVMVATMNLLGKECYKSDFNAAQARACLEGLGFTIIDKNEEAA